MNLDSFGSARICIPIELIRVLSDRSRGAPGTRSGLGVAGRPLGKAPCFAESSSPDLGASALRHEADLFKFGSKFHFMLYLSDAVEDLYGSRLEEVAPNWDRFISRVGSEPPDPSLIEVVYFSGDVYPERAREFALMALKAENLKWLHTFSAGIDDPFFQALLEKGVKLTTSSGVHAVPIAQTVLLYLLALTRDLPSWLVDQSRARWNPRSIRSLQGLKAGVLGLGPIGTEVAKLLKIMKMDVVGFRREIQGEEPCPTFSVDRLDLMLPELDVVVIALPLNSETHEMIDASRFALMKPGVLLVNVGRGACVDEPALIRALESGRVAGAGLDVFVEEPLPEESPLWSMPNVIVTPHSSGDEPGNHERASDIFLQNVERYRAGRPLLNDAQRLEKT